MAKRALFSLVPLLLIATSAFADVKTVTDAEASKYVGESVAVTGVIANVFQSGKGNIFLNFGKPYPNHRCTGSDSPGRYTIIETSFSG